MLMKFVFFTSLMVSRPSWLISCRSLALSSIFPASALLTSVYICDVEASAT